MLIVGTGLQDFITGLTSVVTGEALWEPLVGMVAFIGALVVFAFTLRVLRRATGGAQRGKAKF